MRASAWLTFVGLTAPPWAAACTLDVAGTATDGGGSGDSGGQGAGGSAPIDPVCGNSVIEMGEDCDDGGSAPGDRCGATCRTEDPNQCDGAPISITLGETIVISDDTTGATDKVDTSAGDSSCEDGTWPGVDLIYAVQPAADGTLRATLEASYDDHYLHTRTACPGTKGDELSCDYDGQAGTSDVITAGVAAGQTYFVIVDSWQSSAGTFTLTLTLTP